MSNVTPKGPESANPYSSTSGTEETSTKSISGTLDGKKVSPSPTKLSGTESGTKSSGTKLVDREITKTNIKQVMESTEQDEDYDITDSLTNQTGSPRSVAESETDEALSINELEQTANNYAKKIEEDQKTSMVLSADQSLQQMITLLESNSASESIPDLKQLALPEDLEVTITRRGQNTSIIPPGEHLNQYSRKQLIFYCTLCKKAIGAEGDDVSQKLMECDQRIIDNQENLNTVQEQILKQAGQRDLVDKLEELRNTQYSETFNLKKEEIKDMIPEVDMELLDDYLVQLSSILTNPQPAQSSGNPACPPVGGLPVQSPKQEDEITQPKSDSRPVTTEEHTVNPEYQQKLKSGQLVTQDNDYGEITTGNLKFTPLIETPTSQGSPIQEEDAVAKPLTEKTCPEIPEVPSFDITESPFTPDKHLQQTEPPKHEGEQEFKQLEAALQEVNQEKDHYISEAAHLQEQLDDQQTILEQLQLELLDSKKQIEKLKQMKNEIHNKQTSSESDSASKIESMRKRIQELKDENEKIKQENPERLWKIQSEKRNELKTIKQQIDKMTETTQELHRVREEQANIERLKEAKPNPQKTALGQSESDQKTTEEELVSSNEQQNEQQKESNQSPQE